MAKKKKVSASDIITFYMDYVVENHGKPLTVEDFAKTKNFEEPLFLLHFDSFKEVEQHIFKTLFENSVEILEKNEDYLHFDKKNKLLSLYFTFFENLLLNREYITISLGGFDNQLKALSVFSLLKKSFTSFIDTLELDTLNLNVDALENIQKTTIRESAWVQLLFTIKFWLDDTSPDCEKTDIFIEKSLNTTWELLETKTLNNILDLGKFLFKEKVKPS